MERACESCAREDDDLVAVHRIYLEAAGPDEGLPDTRQATRVEETELWCFACRSLYPHELAE